MTSLQQVATTSYHIPIHTQLLAPPTIRILQEDDTTSHSCTPPPPQNISYFNPLTNETLYLPPREVKVHEIGILFDYEIRHDAGVSWGEVNADVEEEKGWVDKGKDWFGGLFGGGDDDEEEVTAENTETEEVSPEIDANLQELEEYMISQVWKNILDENVMTWGDCKDDCPNDWSACGCSSANDCMGLLVVENETIKEMMLDADEGGDTVALDGEFDVTKLLGITWEPADFVNPEGCVIRDDDTCTAIRGQVAIAYVGDNEYGVIKAVIEQIQDGMDSMQLIPPDSDAQNLKFIKGGGTAPVDGVVNTLITDAGNKDVEESYLSKYGIMFVCFVAILGAGVGAAMYMRYKKRQRAKDFDGVQEITAEEYETGLALAEEADMAKTAQEGRSSGTESPQDAPPSNDKYMNSVMIDEMDSVAAQRMDGGYNEQSAMSANSVEMTLSPDKKWNDVVATL